MNKKYIRLIVFFCIVAIVGDTLPVFARANRERTEGPDTIGVLLPSQRERLWVQLKDSFTNTDITDNTQLRFFYSDMDVVLQEEQLNDALLQDMKVLIIAPVDDISVGRVLNKSRYLPLKVVSIKILPLNTNTVEYFIGYNYFGVGSILAKHIKVFRDYENILFISDGNGTAEQILEGIVEEKVLVDPYMVQQTLNNSIQKQIKSILYPYITSNVIVISDVPYILDTVDIYFEEQSKTNVLFAGVGSSGRTYSRFQKQQQIVSVLEDTDELAHTSTEVAIALFNKKKAAHQELVYNGKKKVRTIYLDPVIVTDKNYENILMYK